jgi:chromosomal replication initiation ATPase DnaA
VYSISPVDLFVKSKRRDIVDARHLLYFLCSERPMRIRYIQQYMEENGYKVGHSTIIHGIKQIREKSEYDTDYQKIIKDIKECITL